MECRLCGHPSNHKHGKSPNGSQRYFCPQCQQTFNKRFDTLYYHRHVSAEKIRQVLQAHSEGGSLRGISRTTVVSIVRSRQSAGKEKPPTSDSIAMAGEARSEYYPQKSSIILAKIRHKG